MNLKNVLEYLDEMKNLKLVCTNSFCNDDDNEVVFFVVKHLVEKDKLFYFSIIDEEKQYDVCYDCNNNILRSYGGLEDSYVNFDNLQNDIKKVLKKLNSETNFSTGIGFDINNANMAFKFYYQFCDINEEPPIRGFTLF
jgi:hypothetical protein